jgi:hypothetical protein
MRNVSDKICIESQNTHFIFGNFFSGKSYRLRDNVEKYGRTRQATDDNIARCVPFACCITKATDTHSQYVIRTASPGQQWLHESASVLRCMYIAVLFINDISVCLCRLSTDMTLGSFVIILRTLY